MPKKQHNYPRLRRDNFSLAHVLATGALFAAAFVIISMSLADGGFDFNKATHAARWTALPLLGLMVLAPMLASSELVSTIGRALGVRAFERTVWALASLGLFVIGIDLASGVARALCIAVGAFWLLLQTIVPDWTLTGSLERVIARCVDRWPGLEWLNMEAIESAAPKTVVKRHAVLALLIFGVLSAVAGSIGIALLDLTAIPVELVGLALCAFALVLAPLANDPPPPQHELEEWEEMEVDEDDVESTLDIPFRPWH